MKTLEGYEREQELIVTTFEKLKQGLRISTALRERKAKLLVEPWNDRSELRRYDSLTAREGDFLEAADKGLREVRREFTGVKASLESIRVPAGSRKVEHKELVHIREDLLGMYAIIDHVYAQWDTMLQRARRRLHTQLRISAGRNLERTREQLRRLELEELGWERTIIDRIDNLEVVEEKVNRLKATRFLKRAIPRLFTIGTVLSVHSIQRGNFAPEENVSGIIGVFCVSTAAIMYLILLHEFRREIGIVERMLER